MTIELNMTLKEWWKEVLRSNITTYNNTTLQTKGLHSKYYEQMKLMNNSNQYLSLTIVTLCFKRLFAREHQKVAFPLRDAVGQELLIVIYGEEMKTSMLLLSALT